MIVPLPESVARYSPAVIGASMEILLLALAAVVIFFAGMAAYRYALKRDPEKLERWAQEAKRAGDRARDKL